MPRSNTLARTMHDVGLAAWFGGGLMGAVGLNGAASEASDPSERARVASAGWARWTPVNLAAIGAHLAGATVLTAANKGRIASQKGVLAPSVAKTALTVAALAVTGYSRALGQKVMDTDSVPVEGATEPGPATPYEVEQAQRRLRLLQWAIPVLTGGMLVLNARLGEQQRPKEVVAGVARRLLPR